MRIQVWVAMSVTRSEILLDLQIVVLSLLCQRRSNLILVLLRDFFDSLDGSDVNKLLKAFSSFSNMESGIETPLFAFG